MVDSVKYPRSNPLHGRRRRSPGVQPVLHADHRRPSGKSARQRV